MPWIECLISQGSVAWRWRGEPARLLRALLSRGAPEDVATADGTLRSDGFEATTGRTQAELDEMLATSYRGTVVDFTPERVAAAGSELRELVGYLRSQGVAVILVSVPYPPPLLEAVMERSPDIAAEDTAALDALSAATGTTIHRTGSMGEWWTPAASNDLKHLSATGAEAFTRQLWGSLPLRAALLDAIGAEPAASTTP